MAVERPHPLRVGIDGWSPAGKTTPAAELVAAINAAGRTAVQTSLDDFKTAEERYRIPGEQLYSQAVQPHARADVVVDNRDLAHPVLRRRGA
jgi:pantothenate kinase-related protein Tda10